MPRATRPGVHDEQRRIHPPFGRAEARPDGGPRREDFEIREDAIPSPGAGEVVTRTVWLSIDPYMRGRLREQQTYVQPVKPGEVMTGETVGDVIASANPDFVPGDAAVGARGWQTRRVTPGGRMVRLPRHAAPLPAYLGVLGMPVATVPQSQASDALMRLRDGKVTGRLVLRSEAA
jgi:NADPH-dependent curcumin reductase CurA